MARREQRFMFLCFAGALAIGGASIVVQGPLPGDVVVTRSLQAMLGSRPGWAEALGESAKQPVVLLVVLVACGLAFAKGGRTIAHLPVLAYPGALLLNLVLRALVFVPRPGGDLVEVAKVSSDSGLPSTFALVYACVFGVVAVAGEGKSAVSGLVTAAATAAMVVGCVSRVLLGGHWSSQVLASLLLALGFAGWLQSAAPRLSFRGRK
jgi:membrane-associated phospholipid phosphatase